jgi:uncharacterized protein (DUF58 family)
VKHRWEPEWTAVVVGVALAAIGSWVHSTLLAIGGLLIASTMAALWLWQRESLTSVSYERRLDRRRALFGEEVRLELEVVNDKLLPLTWLHVEDQVPWALEVRGAAVHVAAGGRRHEMHHLIPMLPYQRVIRRMTVVCTTRGLHTFGPGELESGDPLCLRRRQSRIRQLDTLLVYPKILRLEPAAVAGLLPLGERRGDPRLAGDPSRVSGVREYRPGDPLRHVDWRATARTGALLVREHEPTSALRVAVFSDIKHSGSGRWHFESDAVELVVSITASLLADLSGMKVPTGLYSSGTAGGRPLVHPPGRGSEALPDMLESLAVASPYGRLAMAEIVSEEGRRLRPGTSMVIVARDFPASLEAALSDVRRRVPVAALWVNDGTGSPPGRAAADSVREVSYDQGWKTAEVLEITA